MKPKLLKAIGIMSLTIAIGGFIGWIVFCVLVKCGVLGKWSFFAHLLGFILLGVIEVVALVLGFISRNSPCGGLGVCVSGTLLVIWMLLFVQTWLSGGMS